MIRPLFAAASAFGLVLAAQPALAGTSGGRQLAVDTSDLDLATPLGAAKYSERVDRAARKACKLPLNVGIMISQLDQECYSAAVSSVRQNVVLARR